MSRVLKSDYFVFSILFLLAYFLISNTLFVGFNIDDDHQFISMRNEHNLFKDYGGNWSQFIEYQVSWFKGARFFPFLTTIIFVKAKILGSNYFMQHFIVFISGVLCSFLIYKIFRLKNFSTISSLIGALVFFTGNEYAEIFWRLICGEGPGLLLYLSGVYFTLLYFKNQNHIAFYLSVSFLTLAALTKESFILLMPLAIMLPLIGIRNWEEMKQIIIMNKKFYLSIISVLVILITIVVIMVLKAEKLFDYGSPLSTADVLLNNLYFTVKWFFPYFIIVLPALILSLKSEKAFIIWQLSFFTVIWIAAHLIVYHKVIISFSMGKYIMPGGLVLIIILVCAIEYLKKYSAIIFKISLIILGFLLVRYAKITYIRANEYAAKVEAFNDLIKHLIQKGERAIAVYDGIEFNVSVMSHFKANNYNPIIYSTKAIVDESKAKSKYHNEQFKDEMFASLNKDFPNRTLEMLALDSSLKTLVIAEPFEVQQIAENKIKSIFPNKTTISKTYNNPKFSDLKRSACWQGKLNKSQITYMVFSK
ncbi:MAG TPA: hypothetical protein PK323_01715 [Bacteroidia bacterium]|nr:hypothetical protein [Bacteroidia bacterium]